MSDYYDRTDGTEVNGHEMEDRYQDALNECYPGLTIAGYEYDTARALKEVDPIAYRCGFADYIDSEIGETIVEDGYWVRALTEDGELFGDEAGPDWYTDEDDAHAAFSELVELLSDPDAVNGGPVTVQLYDTADDILAESRITVAAMTVFRESVR